MARLTPEQRHKNMAAIRGKDTKPEMVVRRYLWSHGFRYRLNHTRLPGKPDIVLRKYRTCVFVNGCFWHGHNLRYDDDALQPVLSLSKGYDNDNFLSLENSECCKIPKTNRGFWVRKILRNKDRDIEVQRRLATMGWHCITIWECQLKGDIREKTLQSLAFTLNHIFLNDHKVNRYRIPDEEEYGMVAEERTI